MGLFFHGAGFVEAVMEIECFFKQMRGLAVAASFASSVEIIQQQRLIFRVSNLIDDDRSFFFRGQATEVSNAAFGNDNVNVEGCMVDLQNGTTELILPPFARELVKNTVR